MPIKSLPPGPSLKHLKYQAKDLVNALSQGNSDTSARVREFHPKFARASDDEIRTAKLSLADAQLVIAREYGFPSWPKLKHHVEVSAQAAPPATDSLSSFKPPTRPVELKQVWPTGTRIVREMELKQFMEIHNQGKLSPVEHKLFLKSQYAFTVKELPGGSREVELQHLSFGMELESGGFLWQYDSARSSAADLSPIADLFKTIMDAKVRYFLDANNRVERMEGVDELVKRLNVLEGAKLKPGMTWDNKALDKVLNRIISGAQQPLESMAAGLRIMYGKDHFTNKMDAPFLQGKAVQPGDTWNYSRESQRFIPIKVGVIRDCAVTFKGWELRGERLCARLEFQGTEKSRLQRKSEAAGAVVPLTDGTYSGVVWFDPESGRGIETNSIHDFEVIRNDRTAVLSHPAGAGKIPLANDRHHQVVTEKLVSVTASGV